MRFLREWQSGQMGQGRKGRLREPGAQVKEEREGREAACDSLPRCNAVLRELSRVPPSRGNPGSSLLVALRAQLAGNRPWETGPRGDGLQGSSWLSRQCPLASEI